MSFPLAAVAILSIEVTRALVALGYGLGYNSSVAGVTASGQGSFTSQINPATSLPWPPLAIVGCTGAAVPVVITTAFPHGVSLRGIGGMSCIVSGILGNLAANNIDTDPRSRTKGLPAGILAVPTSTTTLALYGQDFDASSPTAGALIPIVGSGAYTGGGTIVPALTDGSILIGRENTREHSAPPRVVLVPKSVERLPRRASLPNPARNADRQTEIRQRSIGTDAHVMVAHCWGQATPPDPAQDFVLTNLLGEAIRAALHDLAEGTSDVRAGEWDDQKERETQHIKAGHLLTFGMSIHVPVLDNPIAGGLPFVPPGSAMRTTVQTPTPEIGATFDLPVTPG